MSKTKEVNSYQFYGKKVSSSDLKDLLTHVIETNRKNEMSGRDKYPLCIWGTHGIGKTQIVESFAKQNNYEFTYIAPAQFEEMGDLLGLPETVDGQTVTLPPSWIPTTAYNGDEKEGFKGGIFLIDDVNRADDRILRGIMQLLQNYELATWKLPKGWQIVLTANPDGGDYSVTPMDDAMLTRAIHVTLKFEPQEWAKWAESADIDGRGISFVLTYPEVFSANATRTTGRSMTQFLEMIKDIDTKTIDNLGLISMLGNGCLDEATIAKFVDYLRNNKETIISPDEIIRAKDWSSVEKQLNLIIFKGKKEHSMENMRSDLSALIANRIRNHMYSKYETYEELEVNNVINFLSSKFILKDSLFEFLRTAAAKSSQKNETPEALKFFANFTAKAFSDPVLKPTMEEIVKQLGAASAKKKKE